MNDLRKPLIFLCTGAAKNAKKLSSKVAARLETMGIGNVGDLENLSMQHNAGEDQQRNMIFLNDCRSGCVRVLTQGFSEQKFLFFDLSIFLNKLEVDVDDFIQAEMLPKIKEKFEHAKIDLNQNYIQHTRGFNF